MNEVCYLPTVTESFDELNQPIQVTVYDRQRFCEKKSIPQSEFFQANQQGIKASVCLIVQTAEYSGEETVKYRDTVYHVYRVYETHDETTELYCEVRSGDQG